MRAIVNAPSRRMGRYKTTLNRRVEVSGMTTQGNEVKIQVPISEIPPYEFILHLTVPGILRGVEPNATGSTNYSVNIPESKPLQRLQKRLGLKQNSGDSLLNYVRSVRKSDRAVNRQYL